MISLWAVIYAVGWLFCTCFLFVLFFVPYFPSCQQKQLILNLKIGHFTPPVLSHLKSVRKDQSVLVAVTVSDSMDRDTGRCHRFTCKFLLLRKENLLVELKTFSSDGGRYTC